jgi:hypothetical protein
MAFVYPLNISVSNDPYYNIPTYSDPVIPLAVLSAVNTYVSPTALTPYPLQPLYNPLYLMNNILPRPFATYPNVNTDNKLRDSMVSYYWNKLVGWFKYSYKYQDLYNYLVMKGDKVVVSKYQETKNDDKELQLKYNFLINEVIEESDLYTLLDKFCKINNVNWWDLKKDYAADKLKAYIHSRIKDYLRENVKE